MENQRLEEFHETDEYNGSKVTKYYKCEKPPEILCIHLNRIPNLQLERANYKKKLDLGETLDFPVSSRYEGRNSKFLNIYSRSLNIASYSYE